MATVLGERGRDLVTDFEGVIVARMERLHAPPKLCLEALSENGVGIIDAWLEESRVKIIPRGSPAVANAVENAAPAQPQPTREDVTPFQQFAPKP